MSRDGVDGQLYKAVFEENPRKVKAALAAGANANGLPDELLAPIALAALRNHAGIVNLLLEQGADPDRPVSADLTCPGWDVTKGTLIPGQRALHMAARWGNVEIVRVLLEQPGADPNVTDTAGNTPLMATCGSSEYSVETVSLLLEAGADPVLAQQDGLIPLHLAAELGHTDLVDMLSSRAPATLSRCSSTGRTPLLSACHGGHESTVSKLLSLGATQLPPDGSDLYPLGMATQKGFVGVVRVLISEGGIRAVGGVRALALALCMAVSERQAKILQLLLAVDGRERRLKWANRSSLEGKRLLHFGAGYCYPAAVSVLLEAGADEAACGPKGLLPRDVIGVDLGRSGEPPMDRRQEVAIRRMLQRGPAYRARSWAWPTDEETGASGSGDGDTAAAAAAAAAVLSSPPAVKTPPVISLRIFRPTEESNRKFFVRVIGRYCEKD